MGAASNPARRAVQTVDVTVPTKLEPGVGLVFKPIVHLIAPDTFRLMGEQRDESIVPWGFWFGAIFATIGAAILVYFGSLGFWSVGETALGVGAVVTGLLFFRYGVTSRLRELELAMIDGPRGTLALVGKPQFSLAEIEEVVFGLTRYPEAGVKVQVFTLLIRVGDTLFPVVEASPDKGLLFEVAKVISRLSGAPLKQVGEGVV